MAQISEPFRIFCISKARALQNLNEIPVLLKERRISEAYMLRGGRDAAQEEKRKIQEEEEREREAELEAERLDAAAAAAELGSASQGAGGACTPADVVPPR